MIPVDTLAVSFPSGTGTERSCWVCVACSRGTAQGGDETWLLLLCWDNRGGCRMGPL
jgi:hypothetical protein